MRRNARAPIPELLALLALTAMVAFFAGWRSKGLPELTPLDRLPAEARPYAQRYGPEKHSQFTEEWLVRDFFQDKRDGFFVDIGAHHYKEYNNTYYLDVVLGWTGLAVEPQTQFAADYRAHRPRTKFRPFFVSDVSDSRAKMYVLGDRTRVSSADRSFTERHGGNATELTAPTITLTELLQSEGVASIDFLNMDIELHEPQALAGFDLARFKPALVCIEAHPEVRQAIIDYFANGGYVIIGKYLRADPQNLWFTPR